MSAGGRLVLLCGLPGAGKSTWADRLVLDDPAVRVMQPDEWLDRARLSQWDSEARTLVEEAQWRLTQVLLARGETVVVDWGVWGADERQALREGGQLLGASVELVWFDVSFDELRRRVSGRRQEDPPMTVADLRRAVDVFERPDRGELDTYDLVTRLAG